MKTKVNTRKSYTALGEDKGERIILEGHIIL